MNQEALLWQIMSYVWKTISHSVSVPASYIFFCHRGQRYILALCFRQPFSFCCIPRRCNIHSSTYTALCLSLQWPSCFELAGFYKVRALTLIVSTTTMPLCRVIEITIEKINQEGEEFLLQSNANLRMHLHTNHTSVLQHNLIRCVHFYPAFWMRFIIAVH